MQRKSVFVWLFAGTTVLVPGQALAMPQAIAGLLLPLITSSPIFFLGPAAVSAVTLGLGYALAAGLSFGLSALLAPDRPDVPKPEDGKYNLKQSVPSLSFVLGKVKKGGDYVFLEEKGGVAYHITVLAGHRIKSFLEHWLHDEKVTLDGSGNVVTPSHFVLDGNNYVIIRSRRGLAAETAYGDVVSDFSGTVWTNDHRGDGLASVLMRAGTTAVEDYQKVFPHQMPQHTAVIEGNDQIYDPRTSTSGYTTNLALFRLWHLTHPVGGKLALSDMYLPEWSTAANVCDETVTNRSGGTEKRYLGGLWFRANNDPVQIGRLMDQAAELVVYERADGLVGVFPGKYVAPDVRLDESSLIAVSFDTNRRRASNVLAVRGQYTSIEDGFSTKDAAPYGNPYIDDTERTRTIQNQAVQSHNHMARLEKITYIRANAPRVTVLAHYHAAKNARFRRFVKVHYPPRLDEAIIEITEKPKLSLRNLTVEITGIVVPPTLYDFVAATDEGAPGVVPTPVVPTGVPLPVNFNVVINQEVVAGGQTAAYALATWNFVANGLVYELEWEPNAGGEKRTVISKAGQTSVRSAYLADGVEFRFRLRAWSAGVSSGWTAYVIKTVVADPTAPAAVTGASMTGGAGKVTFNWTAPNDTHYYGANLYLNTVNNPGTATKVATEYGASAAADSRVVTGLSAGTKFGWIKAINPSGIEAATAVATGSAVVT